MRVSFNKPIELKPVEVWLVKSKKTDIEKVRPLRYFPIENKKYRNLVKSRVEVTQLCTSTKDVTSDHIHAHVTVGVVSSN